MNAIKIFKALANPTRVQILEWLKEPKRHFIPVACDSGKTNADPEQVGVCVGLIQQKAGLSQSTISQYLALLQDAGLIVATRIGQWTYYKRNEAAISEFINSIKENL